MQVELEASWKAVLQEEIEADYFIQLMHFLDTEKSKNKIIYPAEKDIFNALFYTPFEQVKVVLLGQDPYHGFGQAHGLCFSVQDGVKIPPSLRNIFKELHQDIGKEIPTNGNLTHWAKQGILMLNTTLTVEENKPMSHANMGWEKFTDAIIRKISEQKNGILFLLWGKHAQSKIALIDATKHRILEAAHPSPLSAYQGFFGCKHFSKTNSHLQEQGQDPIDF